MYLNVRANLAASCEVRLVLLTNEICMGVYPWFSRTAALNLFSHSPRPAHSADCLDQVFSVNQKPEDANSLCLLPLHPHLR